MEKSSPITGGVMGSAGACADGVAAIVTLEEGPSLLPEDRIKKVGKSRLQHGLLSNRVYLMHLVPEDAGPALAAMERLADENGYTKLFAKIPAKSAAPFERQGFQIEARIPDFYPDGDEALFMARFVSKSRHQLVDAEHIEHVLRTAKQRIDDGVPRPLPNDAKLMVMTTGHAEQMAAFYSRVFKSYPFPIFDPLYLRRTMEKNFRYFGIVRAGELLALASTETNDGGVEMTDFATRRTYRKAGLAGHLLSAMEADAREGGVKTAFSIARAASYGINILFARGGYAFAGTLVNNTNIAGQVESMSVWYKPLGKA